MLTVHKAYNKD